MTSPRRRLKPDERRDQLLDIGAELFAARPYEDVLMEEVATRAGVSRALLYRHFPGKRDLFAAIYRRAADDLLAATDIDPGKPMSDWVNQGLDAHVDYFVANSHTVLAANRGELSGDPLIQGIISDELSALRRRMLDATGLDGHPREIASAALLGWLAFVRTICVEWLQHRTISRAELRDVCLRTLRGALDI